MEKFVVWLCEEKTYAARSARDVSSRLKRVFALLGDECVNNMTIEELERNEEFADLSVSVRSQLRKSVRLYLEYQSR